MHTSTFSSSLRYAFMFLLLLRFMLCVLFPFYGYASSVHFSSCTQHASTRMNHSQQKQPSLLCSAYIYHAKSSARSSMQLIIFFGGYTESVHHQWLILRFFAFSGSATLHLLLSQLSLSSLLQLQTSTLFHLSIVSMMSLHSTGSYLETLQLLWRSP
jgi:hypothetical protein